MYCILKCPKCNHIQGSEFPIQSTLCKKCGKRYLLKKTEMIEIYQDIDKMRTSLLKKNFGSNEDLDDFIKLNRDNSKKNNHERPLNKEGRINKIITLMKNGPIEQSSLREMCRDIIPNDMEFFELVTYLEKNCIIYSPRYGFYSIVEGSEIRSGHDI